MSLIEEALRRVKDPLVPPASTPAQTPRTTAPSQARATAHSWSPAPASSPSPAPAVAPSPLLALATIAILGLTAALLAGGAMWMWRTLNHERTPVAQAPLGTDAAVEPPASPARPLPAAPPADAVPEFNLTGIVEGLGAPYAVINGSIVAEGETVGKATLLDIGEGTVRLRFADGTETVLRVAR